MMNDLSYAFIAIGFTDKVLCLARRLSNTSPYFLTLWVRQIF